MPRASIVVVGSSNTDMILSLARIPGPGETLLGGRFSTAAGGKGANQAVAARRAGARVAFVCRVGRDALGREALARFASEGIDTSHATADPGHASGVALIFVSSTGENSIGVAGGANSGLKPRHVRAARRLIEAADALVLQLETPLETVREAARLARRAGVPVILNPAPARALPDSLLRAVSVLTPNETEAAALTGVRVTDAGSAARAARLLIRRGVSSVIVTLGAKGALVADGASETHIPAFKVKAVDTTAAGDVFNGALAARMGEGAGLLEAARFAGAAAALSVTRRGAQPSVPTRREIETLLKR